MNKQSIIGLVLIFGIFVGYMWWVAPSQEEIQARRTQDSLAYVAMMEEQRIQDSIAEAQKAAAGLTDSTVAAGEELPAVATEEEKAAALNDKYRQFAASAVGENRSIVLANEKMSVDFSTLGAQIQRVVLHDYSTYYGKELELISPADNNMNLSFNIEGRDIQTKDLVFVPYMNGSEIASADTIRVAEGDSATICFRAFTTAEEGQEAGYLEFAYTLRDNHDLGYDVTFHNLTNVVKANSDMYLFWNNSLNRQEKVDKSSKGGRKDSERLYTSIYYKPINDDVDYLREGSDDEETLNTGLTWVAFKQQFFSAILICDSGFASADMKVATLDDTAANYLCDMSAALGINYTGEQDFTTHMHFYLGSNKYRDLRDMDQDFEQMLPLGWGFFLIQWVSRFAVIPVFNFLEQFNWNYGIIIIVLTILLKIVLFPLTYKSYKSSAVMRILKPEMDALSKKYPNQDQMMQRSQEQQKLYKRAGISPMAGCLPMLLQLPILYAMFRFFPASIELRQKGFLWCDDLSTYDSVLDFGFNIPLYGDHFSLFCFLMFAMQFFYTWYTMKSQAGQASMPGMKFMMYFMPFMMLFMFNSMSAALNLYYLLSLSITMIQMILIRKFTSEKKVRARMAAYDANPGKGGKKGSQKKSKFQQRLEQLQKQAEEMQKQQQKQRK